MRMESAIMMRYHIITLVILIIFLLAGCSLSDPLIGDFSEKKDGEAQLRITKKDSQHFLSEWSSEHRTWGQPVPLNSCGPKEYKFIFGDNWQQYDPVGVCKETLGFFYSRKTKNVPKLTTTGYFVFVGLGGGQLFKVK